MKNWQLAALSAGITTLIAYYLFAVKGIGRTAFDESTHSGGTGDPYDIPNSQVGETYPIDYNDNVDEKRRWWEYLLNSPNFGGY